MNPNQGTIPTPKHKRDDETFQRAPIEHWLPSGQSARQPAAELGLATQTLQNWQEQFKALPGGGKRNCTGWCSNGTF